jgi:hypothetical protein
MGLRSLRGRDDPIEKPTQKQAARETPRAGWGTYSGQAARVKENRAKKGPELKDLAEFLPARGAASR